MAREKKVTKKHRRLAFQHAKQHVLEDLKTMFSDLISDEAHSIIRSSDGVDLGEEVIKYLERYEWQLLKMVRRDAFSRAVLIPGKRRAR